MGSALAVPQNFASLAPPSRKLGSLAICACAIGGGVANIILHDLKLPASTIVFYRMFFAVIAIVLGAIVLRRFSILRPAHPVVYCLGGLLALHLFLFFAALHATSATSAVLATYMSPIFMAVLAPLLLKERLRRSTLIALGIAVLGICSITLADPSGRGAVHGWGVFLALLAGLVIALVIVLTKRYAPKINAGQFILHESIAAAILFAPAALLVEHTVTPDYLLRLIVLGVIFSGLVGMMFIWAIPAVRATTAGIVTYLEPVTTAVLSALFLSEALTLPVLLGGVLILIAGAIVVIASANEEQVQEQLDPSAPVGKEVPALSGVDAG